MLAGASLSAQAAITAEEAARLGTELTPLGANPKGNAEGTIPAWTGGLATPPAGYKKGSGNYVDPFAGEEPLYVITAANMAQYEQYLSDGHKELLKRFPDTYKMPVYPSHRTAAFPQQVYADIKRDAQTVELIDNGDSLKNMGMGRTPFPIPKTGVELVWNTAHRYFHDDMIQSYANFPVQTNGAYTPVKARQQLAWAPTLEGSDEFGIKVFYEMFSPSSVAGTKLLVHEPVNQSTTPRQTWVYNPGQRRVLRAPEISYDTPLAGSDGLVTNDVSAVCFNGAKDRFDFTLIGKRDMIVPYNNYKLNSLDVKYADMIGPKHVNPELMRYELHRVWVVEGKLRQGKRHVFSSRRLYFDEDSHLCTGSELYDGRGDLWRVIEVSSMQMYDIPMLYPRAEMHYDLQARRYFVQYAANEESPYTFGNGAKPSDFTISKLRRSGR